MFSCVPLFNKHVESLDKRQCNLNHIPEEILRHARSLEELLLDSNHIKEISKHVFRMQKLRRLALSDNEIFKVPSEISSLQSLVELDLSKNGKCRLVRLFGYFASSCETVVAERVGVLGILSLHIADGLPDNSRRFRS
ncbi:unnamed protein product [Soboliphyme baturini]|uniref:CARMIL_C domain-containing protein n=1 Tax=Soboliphyme baturini TaxID=241478 RepID=A0A183IDT2_9BILA|nr:unnamed protein product [Soboliphyme baturini]